MEEFGLITVEGIEDAAHLLHKNKPHISHKSYLAFLSQFVGHSLTEEVFTTHIQDFELEQEVNQALLDEVKRGRLQMTVDDEGQFLFYEPKKNKSKKGKKR